MQQLKHKTKSLILLSATPMQIDPIEVFDLRGEIYQDNCWQTVPKEQIKRQFRNREIKILLCTESASEGLNLQTCSVLINYDLPWNPMRVEQRIGRIDRIGQIYSTVNIHNFYYDGTVEAKVYSRLRDRINAFQSVVGNLQPIVAQVPTFIQQAALSADPEEEGVLLNQFEQVLNASPSHPSLEDMAISNVEADSSYPLPPTPVTVQQIEQLFTRSPKLSEAGIVFESKSHGVWQLNYKGSIYSITFDPQVFDRLPSLRLINFGDPLFEVILEKYRNRIWTKG